MISKFGILKLDQIKVEIMAPDIIQEKQKKKHFIRPTTEKISRVS